MLAWFTADDPLPFVAMLVRWVGKISAAGSGSVEGPAPAGPGQADPARPVVRRRRHPPVHSSFRSEFGIPLFRNGHALVLSSVVTSVVGMLFWVLAARRASPSVVGRNVVAINVLTSLGAVAQLNLQSTLIRFVQPAGARTRRLVVAIYLVERGVGPRAGGGLSGRAAPHRPRPGVPPVLTGHDGVVHRLCGDLDDHDPRGRGADGVAEGPLGAGRERRVLVGQGRDGDPLRRAVPGGRHLPVVDRGRPGHGGPHQPLPVRPGHSPAPAGRRHLGWCHRPAVAGLRPLRLPRQPVVAGTDPHPAADRPHPVRRLRQRLLLAGLVDGEPPLPGHPGRRGLAGGRALHRRVRGSKTGAAR